MTQDPDLLLAWYRYAASAPGFIGAALQRHRDQASLTEEQQRAALGIEPSQYDSFWLRLRAMLLPRPDQFTTDLERIVASLSPDSSIHLPLLEPFIRAGL